MKKSKLIPALLLILLCLCMLGVLFLHWRRAETAVPAAATAAEEPAPAEEPEPLSEEPEPEPAEEPEEEPEEDSGEEPAPAEEPEETAAPPADPNSPAGRAYALGLPAPPEVDPESWELALVNGSHDIGLHSPQTCGYVSETGFLKDIKEQYDPNRCGVDRRVAEPLLALAEGCKEAGLPILLSGGYRNTAEHDALFTRICREKGLSNGKNADGYYEIYPSGSCEYLTGLACDITDHYRPEKTLKLEDTETFRWLKEHCAEYGFILRNPAGKEDLTGSVYEPWHFRYVGEDAARYIMENDLCLEEFLALYGVE